MRLLSPIHAAAVAVLAMSSAVLPVAAHAESSIAAPAPGVVVAKIDGHEIHMGDLQALAATLPPEVRGMPMQMLYPMLISQAVDREALTIAARKKGLDKEETVIRAMHRAQDEVLQNALLSREVSPSITEAAIHARYDRDYKDKPGTPEVHARHILVSSEDAAKGIITQLQGGASFEDLAKKNSTDPGAQNGGDLGWFKKSDMVPEFATAAFAMKPGEVSKAPVHTQFGWHVIKVEDTRTVPQRTFEQMHDEIRQRLIQEGVSKTVTQARATVKVEEFAPDGTPLKTTEKPAEGQAKAAAGKDTEAKSDAKSDAKAGAPAVAASPASAPAAKN